MVYILFRKHEGSLFRIKNQMFRNTLIYVIASLKKKKKNWLSSLVHSSDEIHFNILLQLKTPRYSSQKLGYVLHHWYFTVAHCEVKGGFWRNSVHINSFVCISILVYTRNFANCQIWCTSKVFPSYCNNALVKAVFYSKCSN